MWLLETKSEREWKRKTFKEKNKIIEDLRRSGITGEAELLIKNNGRAVGDLWTPLHTIATLFFIIGIYCGIIAIMMQRVLGG